MEVVGILALILIVWLVWRAAKQASEPKTPEAVELLQQLNHVSSMSGVQFEHYVASVFRALGYNAAVQGGAGDQGVDVIVASNGQRQAIQCKNYAKPVGNSPVQQVYAGARYHRCDVAMVIAPNGYTKGAVTLAQSVGVKLADANDLRRWIRQIEPTTEAGTEPTPRTQGTSTGKRIGPPLSSTTVANSNQESDLHRELQQMIENGALEDETRKIAAFPGELETMEPELVRDALDEIARYRQELGMLRREMEFGRVQMSSGVLNRLRKWLDDADLTLKEAGRVGIRRLAKKE